MSSQLAHNHDSSKGQFISFNAILNRDPSRTLTLRNAFAADMRRRFRKLTRIIWGAIVDKDVFGLKREPEIPILMVLGLSVDEALAKLDERQFVFRTSAGKVEAFMDWLNEIAPLNMDNI